MIRTALAVAIWIFRFMAGFFLQNSTIQAEHCGVVMEIAASGELTNASGTSAFIPGTMRETAFIVVQNLRLCRDCERSVLRCTAY